MTVVRCPDCNKVISTEFAIHDCRRVIRYFVSPASTIRGWLVKRVLLVNGSEVTDLGWYEKFLTKREAKAEKEKRNKQLGRDFVAVTVK